MRRISVHSVFQMQFFPCSKSSTIKQLITIFQLCCFTSVGHYPPRKTIFIYIVILTNLCFVPRFYFPIINVDTFIVICILCRFLFVHQYANRIFNLRKEYWIKQCSDDIYNIFNRNVDVLCRWTYPGEVFKSTGTFYYAYHGSEPQSKSFKNNNIFFFYDKFKCKYYPNVVCMVALVQLVKLICFDLFNTLN